MAAASGQVSTLAAPLWLSAAEEEAWVGLLRLVQRLPAVLDVQLQQDAGLSLFEYLVMSRLSMAPGRILRMSELAEQANGSLSRLSNVVKRLEAREYIRREPDPVNGRYTNAMLTESGWDKVVATAPGHVSAVRQLVFDPLTASQITALGALGTRLADHAEESCLGKSAEDAACSAEPMIDESDPDCDG